MLRSRDASIAASESGKNGGDSRSTTPALLMNNKGSNKGSISSRPAS